MAVHELFGKVDAAEARKADMREKLALALADVETGACDALMICLYSRSPGGDPEAYATRTLFGAHLSPLERVGLVATELNKMLG
jgi:hypothetical protein